MAQEDMIFRAYENGEIRRATLMGGRRIEKTSQSDYPQAVLDFDVEGVDRPVSKWFKESKRKGTYVQGHHSMTRSLINALTGQPSRGNNEEIKINEFFGTEILILWGFPKQKGESQKEPRETILTYFPMPKEEPATEEQAEEEEPIEVEEANPAPYQSKYPKKPEAKKATPAKTEAPAKAVVKSTPIQSRAPIAPQAEIVNVQVDFHIAPIDLAPFYQDEIVDVLFDAVPELITALQSAKIDPLPHRELKDVLCIKMDQNTLTEFRANLKGVTLARKEDFVEKRKNLLADMM
jgi:hypothetical protein